MSAFEAWRKWFLPVLFLVLALPIGTFTSLLMPLGEQPDELTHIARANSVLHFELLGHREPRPELPGQMDAGVTANPASVFAAWSFTPGSPLKDKKMTPTVIARLKAVRWYDHLTFVHAPNTATYFPVFYVPAALGMGFAHLAGHGPYWSDMAGRLANMVCYALIGFAALLVARRGRLAIFAALTVPMSLSLAAAIGQDGLTIAISAACAAALTRAGPERRWWRAVAGVGIAALIAAKPPLLPLAFAMLGPLPLRGLRWRDFRRAMTEVVVVALPGLLWTALTIWLVAVPFVRGTPYHPGPLWHGNPATVFPGTDMRAQLGILLHDPALIVMLPIRTMIVGWDNYLKTMIGVLGQLNLTLPDGLYELWEIALVAAIGAEMLQTRRDAGAIRGAGALAIGLAVPASVFAIFLTQWLSWTLVGSPLIEGVQGRYFLPLIPFLGIALPSLGTVWLAPARWIAGAPLLAAGALNLGFFPLLLVTTYYLH